MLISTENVSLTLLFVVVYYCFNVSFIVVFLNNINCFIKILKYFNAVPKCYLNNFLVCRFELLKSIVNNNIDILFITIVH